MSRRRIATIAVGVVFLVFARVLDPVVGGYAAAVILGVGLGTVIVGVGRREPHLLRRRGEPDEPGAAALDRDDDRGDRWSEW